MTKPRDDLPDTDEMEDLASTDPGKPLRHVRRERAIQLYMGGATKKASYEGAGFAPDEHGRHPYRLFDSPDVARRVEYLQAQEADKASEERAHLRMTAGYTKLKAMTHFELARVLAMKNDRPSAAVSAVLGMCKLEGLIREALPMTPTSLSDMSVEQLEQFLGDISSAERVVADALVRRGIGDTEASGDRTDPPPRPN